MKRDDDQELWDLLGRGPEPKVSPFFARNVLREIRRPTGWEALRPWLSPRRLVPATALATALIAVFLLRMQTPVVPSVGSQSEIVAIVDAEDNDVLADLDDLIASDDSNSWDEESVLL